MTETGWLIERKGPYGASDYTYSWWTGTVDEEMSGIGVWTQDPNACVRFARKVDAEMVIVGVLGLKPNANVIATEHEWG